MFFFNNHQFYLKKLSRIGIYRNCNEKQKRKCKKKEISNFIDVKNANSIENLSSFSDLIKDDSEILQPLGEAPEMRGFFLLSQFLILENVPEQIK